MRSIATKLVGYKLFVFIFIVLALKVFPVFSEPHFRVSTHFPQDRTSNYSDRFQTWDGHLYLHLAEFGYDPANSGSMTNAFYPLWPWAIKAFSPLTGGNYLWAALILAFLFSCGGFLLLYRFIHRQFSEELAQMTVLLMLAYPGVMFMNFPYSEPLFFFLLLVFFNFLYLQKPWPMMLAAFLLPLTRAVGIFCLLPMAIQIYQWKTDRRKYLALLAPLFGYLAYFLYMFWATGDPYEGFHAQQRYVAKASLLKVFDVFSFLKALVQPFDLHPYLNSGLDRFVFLLFLPALVGTWFVDRGLFAFALMLTVVPAMSLTFMSFSRHLSVVFPVFLSLGKFCLGLDISWRRLILVSLLMLQILFLLMHINNFWVG